MDFEIDLLALAKALWSKAWLVITVTILCAAVANGATRLFVTPIYQSKFTAYVNNKSENTTTLSSSDLTAAHSLTNTYAEIIRSRSVLEKAAKASGILESYGKIRSQVSVSIASNTQIMTISVVMEDKEQAYQLAKAIADYIPDYAAQIVEGSSMKLIDLPLMPTSIYAPNYQKNTWNGALLGFLAACIAIVLRELLDMHVKDSTELEERFGIAVIGTIPNVTMSQKIVSKYGSYGYGVSAKGGGSQNG